jgi:hypothetical protein
LSLRPNAEPGNAFAKASARRSASAVRPN